MSAYEMLVQGHFELARVRVQHEPGSPARAPGVQAAIESEWRARLAPARREGLLLTNGALLRLARFDLRDDQLSLVLGDTTYADFLATNCDGARRAQLPWEELANPLGTSALIRTRDGDCVLGLRGERVLHLRGHVHTIGGMFEAVDLVEGRVDAAGSILREAREELGIVREDVRGLVCRGIMRESEHLQPELMFELELGLTSAQLDGRWSTAESRDEHSELVQVPDEPAAIRDFLAAGHPMAPQARAALELRLAGPGSD